MGSEPGGPDGEGKQKLSRWQIGNGSLSVLEQVYQMDPFPGLDARRELAKQLSVSPRQVQVWFQNKRQRERKISRQKGLLSTPGLPDTPAAQAAQAAKVAEQATAMVHVAQLGNGEAAGGSCLLQPGTSADGAANAPGCAQPSAGAPAAAVGLAPAQLQQPGGSSGAGEPGTSGSSAGDGAASSMQQQPSAPRDFLFGLPMSRAVSNPAIGKLEGGIARSVSAGHDLYIGGAADPDLSKEATDRLGVSPLKQQRTAQHLSGLPMSRSISLDASLLNHGSGRMDGPLGIGRNASFDAALNPMPSLRPPGQPAARLPWLCGLGRGTTALNSADHVEMCRAAVAAAAAAVGKPGAAAAASALPRPGGLPMLHSLSTQQGGVARQHMPLAPSPFDSQLLAQSLRNEPDLMRSLGVAGGPRGSSHGAATSLSGGTAAERTFSGGMHRGVGRTLSQDSDGLVPSLDELAAMEDLPDDLQQAIAAFGSPPGPRPSAPGDGSPPGFDVGATPTCNDVMGLGGANAAAGAPSPARPANAFGNAFGSAKLQGEPIKRSGVSFFMDEMKLGGGDAAGLEAELGLNQGPPPGGGPPSSSHLSSPTDAERTNSDDSTRPHSGAPSAASAGGGDAAPAPAQPLSSKEASDMQAAADSYVQVILAGETPYQIVWASEAWLKLCGYTTEQACGQTLALIEGPLTSAASAEQLMRAIRAGNPTKVPIVHHARGGRAFSHTLRIEPLKDSLGMVQCFQVTSADVQMLKDGDGPSPAEQQQYTSPEHGEGGDQQASKAAAADGEPRLELDEMLEWLDSGSGPRPSGMSRTSSMTKMADAEGQ